MQFTAVSLPTPPDDAAFDHDRLVDAHHHADQEQSYISLTFAKAACINPESYSAARWNAESIVQATIAVTAYGSSDSAPTSAILCSYGGARRSRILVTVEEKQAEKRQRITAWLTPNVRLGLRG